ncbi:hypothetical protein, partial [Tolypothrix sp. VBCCA 56010]|uniref:hypothetical protein n=1 Tax=Tolypothrix sp. VBCCA 56010 TaxID=3137731 RepID=UPI003D7E2C08
AFLGLMRYTRRGTAVPCPYNPPYNFVPHLSGNRYIYSFSDAVGLRKSPANADKRNESDKTL